MANEALRGQVRALPEASEASRVRTPTQLAWKQLKRHRMAVIGGTVLLVLYTLAIFADFFAPYSIDFTDRERFYHPPTPIRFVDAEGRLSLRPFVYPTVLADPGTRTYRDDTAQRAYLRFFAPGEPYRLLWILPTNIHLVGVEPPARLFLLGTDQFGRDLFSRILFGGRVSLFIGIIGVLITIPVGMFYGGISGFYGGRVDNVMMRLAEVIIAFPGFFLLLALAAVLPSNLPSTTRLFMIVAILSFLGWAGFSRLIRGMVLALKSQEYVLAARAAGAGDLAIIARHILPNTISLVIVVATLGIPGAILGESGLSFLGLGIREPQASWGLLLAAANNVQTMTASPWLLAPGLFIIVAVIAYNLLGDGLRDAFDPRLRTS